MLSSDRSHTSATLNSKSNSFYSPEESRRLVMQWLSDNGDTSLNGTPDDGTLDIHTQGSPISEPVVATHAIAIDLNDMDLYE